MMDSGAHMLDIGWHLLGQPKPLSVYAITHRKFVDQLPAGTLFDVEDSSFAIVRFEGGKSLELAVSWALNQPQKQNGTVCRVYGTAGAIEVYTPSGATLLREFNAKGECKENPLKPPRLVHHAAMMRHFKDCIAGKATPMTGGPEGIAIMQMIEAVYRSNASGKSVQI